MKGRERKPIIKYGAVRIAIALWLGFGLWAGIGGAWGHNPGHPWISFIVFMALFVAGTAALYAMAAFMVNTMRRLSS